MLYLSDEIQFGLFYGLEEETVAVIGLAVTEDESQFVAGVVE